MTRLLLFNLATDLDHQVLGFTTEWINRLASYYEAVDVITMTQGRVKVAENVRVYSVGKEKGYSEVRRAIHFYGLLLRLLLKNRYQACFAHMQPLFALMGAPLLAMWRVPIVLWYTHRQNHRVLQWATRFSWRVVSADKTSFPIQTPKLRALGHGIDTSFYAPYDPTPTHPPSVVYVARLSSIKHQETLIRAIHPLKAQAILIGTTPQGESEDYQQALQSLVDQLGLKERVHFLGAQPPHAIRHAYQQATLAVNLSPVGLFDKSALEAMACGVPTITANPAFAPMMAEYAEHLLISSPSDENGLSQKIAYWLAQSDSKRAQVGSILRENAQKQHALPVLIEKLHHVLTRGEP